MGFQIQDGTGKGYVSGVDARNRLLTSTINETTFQHAAEKGDAYFLGTPQITLTNNASSAIFFIENNDLPFDSLIRKKVENYILENNLDFCKAKSIYYNKRKDFKTYLTFRCINNRSTLDRPELEHMSSNEFSFESFLENKKWTSIS